MAIGAMRQEQLGDSETAADTGSDERELFSVPLLGQDAVMSPPDEALLAHLDGCTGGSLWGWRTGEVHTAHCDC